MIKSNLPAPRVQQGVKVQEIKLFDGYENSPTSSPKVLKKRVPKGKKPEKKAVCPESVLYFFFIFVVSVIITGIIASFQR